MREKNIFLLLIVFVVSFYSLQSCKKKEDSNNNNNNNSDTTSTDTSTVPDVYKKIYGATSITIDGNEVVIKVKGLPDHKSPYYQGTQWQSTMYEAYNGTNSSYNQNPNKIAEQDYTFRIPLNPAEDANHEATPYGAFGVAVNGVALYNQYAAPGDDLTQEMNTFDQYNGHPQQQGSYHYHIEPVYLTQTIGSDALIGFLLDGFPVYGPVENGNTITNADLDSYHGHFAVTADYPNGIYHYHITAEDPYINGDGFYGTAGTVTQ